MLHHVSVGVADVARAAQFYDAVLGTLGYKRVMEFMPYAIAYGETAPAFWVQLPHDKQKATVGNGVHIGFIARNKDAVQNFHAAALAAGGKDDGAPGPRPDYGPDYFGAFVLDLDGNKIEATLHEVAAVTAARKDPEEKRKAKEARKAAKAAQAQAEGGKKKKKNKKDKKEKKAKDQDKAARRAAKKAAKGKADKPKRSPEEKAERRKQREADKT